MTTVAAGIIQSSIGRKYIMALSGLFLCTFLIVHMLGNLALFKDDGGQAFNEYTYFMTHNPLIMIISYVNYTFILLHIFYSLTLTISNRKARPSAYEIVNQSKSATWSSRNMGILGSVILIFLIVHMRSFWFEMKFGTMPTIQYEGNDLVLKDMYSVVAEAFTQPWYVALYVVSMFAIAFHLYHGFQSGFQTLGLNHHRYTPIIKNIGMFAFAIVIPALFAAMPLYFLILNL
jgi:succinate dehydrogenase / fumarate reductase cytochrome b subunit